MSKTISPEAAEQELDKHSKKITDKDIQKVIEKEDEIKEKAKGTGPLKEYLDAIKTMLLLVKAYWKGEYREIPWFTIAAIVAALLYVFSPIDLIPDFIPVIGLIDDAMIVAACMKLVKHDLASFEDWRTSRMA